MQPIGAKLLPLALCAAALPLAGCGGFTPLYAAQGVTPKLASIEVSRPDGRTGFYLGRDLDDAFGKDLSQKPVYRLLLRTNEVRIPRGIRVNNVASRYEVDLNTTYTLIEIATRKVVTAGVVKVNVTYDDSDQPYAGLAAEQNGQERAAEQAAERIRIDLATFFASPRPIPTNLNVSAGNIATYSERLQPAQIQSPRQRALGNPTAQSQVANPLGLPTQSTTSPDNPGASPFNPSFDQPVQPPPDTPNTSADPTAIKTIPDPDAPQAPPGG
jgi:LPS-assembly lipoprotein